MIKGDRAFRPTTPHVKSGNAFTNPRISAFGRPITSAILFTVSVSLVGPVTIHVG
jgi:hypothetical protein